jgi:hypothetical protein
MERFWQKREPSFDEEYGKYVRDLPSSYAHFWKIWFRLFP